MKESGGGAERSRELELPPAFREALGLRPDESVRLRQAGARVLFLERHGGVAAPGLPWDQELVLVADVAAFPLPDVLVLLHGVGKSGLLYFQYEEQAKSVYLHRGEVVFASSNQRVDRLGECLLRAGVITLEQLREAERRFTPPERFGKVLVERSFLTPRELWSGVKYQVEEIVRSLFSYTHGSVFFWQGDVQPDNVVRLSLPTHRLVTEGLQRRDELLRFLSLLEDPRVRLEPLPERQTSLSGIERRLFDLLEGDPSFVSLCRRLELDALSGARIVQLLRLAGAVRIRRARDQDGYLDERDLHLHDDETLRETIGCYTKLMHELTTPLVEAGGSEAVRDRLARVVDDLAERFPALLRGLRPGSRGGLDPEALAARALRIPGDREGQVHDALGELVAYLEFELKNHPRVESADAILAALEPLRARLPI